MLDFTSWWAFYRQRQSLIQSSLIALIFFMGGWYLGNLTSFYNSAAPIIFNDRTCSACSSSGGSRGELEALKQQGIAQREPMASVSPSPAVAGEIDQPPSTHTGKYVASVNSKLYHDVSCPSAKQIKPANQVWFNSTTEAEAAGFSPSKCTQDKLNSN